MPALDVVDRVRAYAYNLAATFSHQVCVVESDHLQRSSYTNLFGVHMND
jgi:hypothetical protein